jgi:hypothetical protein
MSPVVAGPDSLPDRSDSKSVDHDGMKSYAKKIGAATAIVRCLSRNVQQMAYPRQIIGSATMQATSPPIVSALDTVWGGNWDPHEVGPDDPY